MIAPVSVEPLAVDDIGSAFLTLGLPSSLRPDWLEHGDRVRCRPQAWRAPEPDARVVAWFTCARELPAIVEGRDGFQPCFDLQATIDDLVQERYRPPPRPVTRWLPFHYHWIPGGLRLAIKRLLTRLRPPHDDDYPSFPADKSVEALRWLARRIAATEERPAWPDGRRYALCLSHDIDTRRGFGHVEAIAAIEERHGFRSAWNVVALGYAVPELLLDRLKSAGHEIGLHGDVHDNTLAYERPERMEARLDACRDFMNRFDVRGFRSPSLCRTPALFRALEPRFLYDSSVPDTDEGSGCGTVFPFRKGGVLELPLSVPMDASLLFLGRTPGEILDAWRRKTEWIRRVGGLALVTTHPEPHMGGRADLMGAYDRFLAERAGDADAWKALPRDVARWWNEGARP